MTGLYLAQLLLPIVLIGWMLWLPARSRLGFFVQCIGSFAALAVMAVRGVWLFPPWWTPYVFGVALGAATWMGLYRRSPFISQLPTTWCTWIVSVSFVALGVVSLVGIAAPLHSRTPPPLPLVNLAIPLEPGRYLVVNGGSDLSTNAHLLTLDASEARFRFWRGQSYGVDLVQLDEVGLRAKGLQPADPHAYRIYGARVLAPCAGQVVLAVDDLPDMRVPEVDREHMAGNHVMLRCNEADVLLGHLSPGSIQVRAGVTVATGDWLGSVGNSGNTGEPHLHVHAQRPGSVEVPLGGDPLPILLNGRFPVRGDRIDM